MAVAETETLIGEAPSSPAGPLDSADAAGLPEPPVIPLPRSVQVLRFNQRQIEFVFKARRKLGEVFTMRMLGRTMRSSSLVIRTTSARCSRRSPIRRRR